MKAIRFPFDHLNLIIDAFQPAGMDGKPAMVKNAVGIIFEHFGKSDHRFNIPLICYFTPSFQSFLNLAKTFALPEFFQGILEQVNHGQILIQFQQSLKLWSCLGKQILARR